METFAVRKAEMKDLETILAIYEHARQFMREHGNPRQWNTTWPPEALLRQDIARGDLYTAVCAEEIAAVFYFQQGEDIDPTYRNIESGHWLQGGIYGVVHRIASAGRHPGAASFCIRWAQQQCSHLRMDTHGDNTVMQNFLKKNGFTQVGIIHAQEDNDPRLAFEKL